MDFKSSTEVITEKAKINLSSCRGFFPFRPPMMEGENPLTLVIQLLSDWINAFRVNEIMKSS